MKTIDVMKRVKEFLLTLLQNSTDVTSMSLEILMLEDAITQEEAQAVKMKAVKVIGIGKEYRPDEHERGEWRDEDGICVEFPSGYRDCFYVSEVVIQQAEAQTVQPVGGMTIVDGQVDDFECYPGVTLADGQYSLFTHPAPTTEQTVEPTLDEQAVFEKWIEHNRPSGDADAVQREWIESGTYADLIDATAPTKLPENCGSGHCSCIECLKPAKPSARERKALIKELREYGISLTQTAADMLAADAQEIDLFDKKYTAAHDELLGVRAQQVAVPQVQWGVDWGSHGDRSCVSIVKKYPDGVFEIVATEYGHQGSAAPQPPQGETK